MRAAILDYGAGNLYSLARAVIAVGAEPVVTSDIDMALNCDALLLPGVGAFGSATKFLKPHAPRIRAALSEGLPCLGICLGMQLLFESSDEGPGNGIGALSGCVRRLNAPRVPQIGWNDLDEVTDTAIRASGLATAYFANSFVCMPTDKSIVTAWTTHGSDRFASAVRSANIVGVQFHPEKSSVAGVSFVGSFLSEMRK
jgi:imidazole glycerol-phosphate synthase subunit HisH